MVLCNDVCFVTEAFGHQHDATKWHLFIDYTEVSLKAAITHNGNKFQSIPLANTSNTKEYYDHMKLLLE
jgi:hypothetical protein